MPALTLDERLPSIDGFPTDPQLSLGERMRGWPRQRTTCEKSKVFAVPLLATTITAVGGLVGAIVSSPIQYFADSSTMMRSIAAIASVTCFIAYSRFYIMMVCSRYHDSPNTTGLLQNPPTKCIALGNVLQ